MFYALQHTIYHNMEEYKVLLLHHQKTTQKLSCDDIKRKATVLTAI